MQQEFQSLFENVEEEEVGGLACELLKDRAKVSFILSSHPLACCQAQSGCSVIPIN
jgi:hypothetical protein